MTLYSDEVRRIIRSYEWPEGDRLRLEVLDGYDDATGQSFLWLRMFRDNFIQFDGVEQLRIAKIMNDLIPRLISSGIPTRLEVAKGDGRVRA